MQDLQQQIMIDKENTSRKFQKMEEMIEEIVQKMKLIQRIRKQKVEKNFLRPFGLEVQNKQDGKMLSWETSQKSPDCKLNTPKFDELPGEDKDCKPNTPKFDELPGEDKEDWHSEEIICIALGLVDFFQPKKNLEEGNSSGAHVLECTSNFRITREKNSGDRKHPDEPTESKPEFQMPNNLIASTKLNELRLQHAPCSISICQGITFSKVCDMETGITQQHLSKGIQVKITNDEAKGVMQLLIGRERASETLEAKRYVIFGAQNLSDSGSVGKFPGEKLELFCVNHLVKYSLKTQLLLDTKSGRKTVLVEDGDGLNSIDVLKKQGAIKEVPSVIPTIEIVEAFPRKITVKKFPTGGIPNDLGMKSRNFVKRNMLIFDSGGHVQNKQSKGVNNKFKDMSRNEVKIEAAVMTISVSGQLKDLMDSNLKSLVIDKENSQLRRKFIFVHLVTSPRIQGQNIEEANEEID